MWSKGFPQTGPGSMKAISLARFGSTNPGGGDATLTIASTCKGTNESCGSVVTFPCSSRKFQPPIRVLDAAASRRCLSNGDRRHSGQAVPLRLVLDDGGKCVGHGVARKRCAAG